MALNETGHAGKTLGQAQHSAMHTAERGAINDLGYHAVVPSVQQQTVTHGLGTTDVWVWVSQRWSDGSDPTLRFVAEPGNSLAWKVIDANNVEINVLNGMEAGYDDMLVTVRRI